VQAWCRQPAIAFTEDLPSHLQSRWVDASPLPSKCHTPAAIREAAADEVAAYTEVLGTPPRIVVPPTFVWTQEVESAWAALGVAWIVTPGCRYTARDRAGEASRTEGSWLNGERHGSVRYIARTDYFEPKKGRDANHALAALARNAAQGRPCVLENHRDNFCRDDALRRHSEMELGLLLRGALAAHRDLRFLSTAELCAILDLSDPAWIETSALLRLPAIWERMRVSGRLWKLMRWSGLAWLGERAIQMLPLPRLRVQAAGCN
jgi:hypothetical protein